MEGSTGRLGRETSRNRRQRERRTKALLNSPKLLDVILSHVRNGGTLINLCETWGVRYSEIITWVRADILRDKAYKAAGEDRSEWTREMILGEIRAIARPDPRKLYHLEGPMKGRLKPIHELDAETARLIHTIESDGKVKLYDRLKALELGARSEALLTDKSEVHGHVTLEDMLGEANKEPAPPAAPEQPGAAA